MTCKMLSWLRIKPAKNLAGSSHPLPSAKLTECYAKIDTRNWWQGDVFSASAFAPESIAASTVPFWMLLNRTCHLYAGSGRKTKLPYLNYAAVYPIHLHVDHSQKTTVKNQISTLLHGKFDHAVFLPKEASHSVNDPLVVNFNLVFTVPTDKCPPPSTKVLQLSSPFSEHVFQKFSRYFYTVGFDDEPFKTEKNISDLVALCTPPPTSK